MWRIDYDKTRRDVCAVLDGVPVYPAALPDTISPPTRFLSQHIFRWCWMLIDARGSKWGFAPWSIQENLMGRFSRSWDILGRSFAILKSDKELLWLPVMSALYCLAATLIICSAAGIAFSTAGDAAGTDRDACRRRFDADLLDASRPCQLSSSGDICRGALPLRHNAAGLGRVPPQ